MPALNIRDVDEAVLYRLKAEAVNQRKTLREYCLEKLTGEAPERKIAEAAVEAERPSYREAPAVEDQPAAEMCPWFERDEQCGELVYCALRAHSRKTKCVPGRRVSIYE